MQEIDFNFIVYLWSLGKYITCCIPAGLARGRALPEDMLDLSPIKLTIIFIILTWLTCQSGFDLSQNACRDTSSHIVHTQKQQTKLLVWHGFIHRKRRCCVSFMKHIPQRRLRSTTTLKAAHSGIKWVHSHTYWVLVLHLLRSLRGHNMLFNLWEEKIHNAHCCCRKK